MVNVPNPTQSLSWSQAQSGHLGAIADLLATALHDPSLRPPLKVEVSRRDRTLHVFLTHAPEPRREQYVYYIRAVVAALGLADIDQLKVLDGTEHRLLDRWQYDFDLPPAPLTPNPVMPSAPWASPPMESSPLPAVAPAPIPRWRLLVFPAVMALGLGLVAAMALGRYDQQRELSQANRAAPLASVGDSEATIAPALTSPMVAAEGAAPAV
ncbi:hypothetical protein IQ254_26990, partial [Nodosilinea sp. LEGE 07088]